jgi:nitrate/nitrite-specific signal transduction histidine kinase
VKASTPQSQTITPAQFISRWRWIILLIGIICVLVIEVIEHNELTAELVFEVVFYGLVIAVTTSLLLAVLARQTAQQAQLKHTLELQREFSRQLARYQIRDELAEFITRFPAANMMPVERVTLFQYDHRNTQLDFVTEWSADGRVTLPTRYTSVPADIRYVRKLCASTALHESTTCPLIACSTESQGSQHVCLPLVHDSILVGLLRLKCRFEEALSPAQTEFLNSISSQVALALALSIAFPEQVTQAQRAERRRVGYELHDSLAQQVGYLHLTLDRLSGDDRLDHIDGLRGELDRLREVANDSYLQIREYLNLLRGWDATDLVQVIGDYVETLKSKVSFEIEYRVAGVPILLEPLICQRIFSLAQESLNNVQKHAQARQVHVELEWRTDQVALTITDDGVGFIAAADPNAGHYGLAMLRERTEALRGVMHIISAPGAGTRVDFQFPIQAGQSPQFDLTHFRRIDR